MLGFVLIYFLGKYFYDLAGRYNQNKWGYGILGVVVYYAASFIAGVIIVITLEITSPGKIDTIGDSMLGIISLPFGLLAAWGLYKILEKRFINAPETRPLNSDSDILDDEFLK